MSTESQILELQKRREEEVRVILEAWPISKQRIAYKFLNASGCTLANIDYDIRQALREELKVG
jgi:hypothetical protein